MVFVLVSHSIQIEHWNLFILNEFQIHMKFMVFHGSPFRIGLKRFCGGTLDDVNGIINLSWLTVRGVTE